MKTSSSNGNVTRAGLSRRAFCLALPSACAVHHAMANEKYPNRPVRLVVASSAGGILDTVGRVVAQGLTTRLGQPFVVENRAGAGGIIGTEVVAKSPGDGYTLCKIATSHVINPSVYAKMPYDTMRDLVPVAQTVNLSNLLVVQPGLAANNLQELIAMARHQPGQLTYASSGNGQSNHLSGATFRSMANIDITHMPYKGGADALTAVLSGTTTMMFVDALSALPHVKAVKLKVIAATGLARSKAIPQYPTLNESGLAGFNGNSWLGLVAPAATPRDIVELISRQTGETLRTPEVRDRLLAQGVEPVGSTPAEFKEFMDAEFVRWRDAAKASGARAG